MNKYLRLKLQIIAAASMLLCWSFIFPVQPLNTSYSIINSNPLITQFSNYPNPFDSRVEATKVIYNLKEEAAVKIVIYDLLGNLVREYDYPQGTYEKSVSGSNYFLWDGTNENGEKVAKGGYLCRILVKYWSGYASAIHKIGVIH